MYTTDPYAVHDSRYGPSQVRKTAFKSEVSVKVCATCSKTAGDEESAPVSSTKQIAESKLISIEKHIDNSV
jgi:sulfur relay (sulfurtransferase) complex TusBCD TusD component (DsrE family)